MTHQLVVRDAARRDLLAAADWYDDQRNGLGKQFVVEMERLLARISRNPLAFPEIESGVRRALTRRFPYALFYTVRTTRITLIAVLHQHRNPDAWRGRA